MVTDTQLKIIPVAFLQPCRFQVRRRFDPLGIAELAESIKAQGIIEPLIVREIDKQAYEIVAGERRWRASQQAGLMEIPCLVRSLNDAAVREIVLIENLQRAALDPIEEAAAIAQLIGGADMKQREVAVRIGKSEIYVAQRLRLLQLSERVKQMLIAKTISAGHAVALVSLPATQQLQLAMQSHQQGWSVRKLEKAVKKWRQSLGKQSLSTQKTTADNSDLMIKLGEYFGTQVKLEANKSGGGYLMLHYYSNDELQGLLEKCGFDYF